MNNTDRSINYLNLNRFTIQSKQQNTDETILRDRKTGQLILMKQLTFNDLDQYKAMIETLSVQKFISSDHILALLDYQVRDVLEAENGDNMEAMYGIVTFYQQASHNLEEQILSRQSVYFQEAELWSVLLSVVMGLACLEKQDIGHGCITTNDIYLTKDGLIKIVDPSLATTSPYQFTQGYFYSPQMIQNFKDNISESIDYEDNSINTFKNQSMHYNNQQIDIYKSDVFSLGMCLLKTALLEQCSECYDYERMCIKPDILRQKFNILVGRYSEQFLDILYQMMSFDVQKRPNFKQLLECLEQYLQTEEKYQPNNLKKVNNLSLLDKSKMIQIVISDQEDQIDTKFVFQSSNQSQNYDKTNLELDNEKINKQESIKSSRNSQQVLQRRQKTNQINQNFIKQQFPSSNQINNIDSCSLNQKQNISDRHNQKLQSFQDACQKAKTIQISFSSKSSSRISKKDSKKNSMNQHFPQVQIIQTKHPEPIEKQKKEQKEFEKSFGSEPNQQDSYQKHIFTDKKLLQMMQIDISKIMNKRKHQQIN